MKQFNQNLFSHGGIKFRSDNKNCARYSDERQKASDQQSSHRFFIESHLYKMYSDISSW